MRLAETTKRAGELQDEIPPSEIRNVFEAFMAIRTLLAAQAEQALAHTANSRTSSMDHPQLIDLLTDQQIELGWQAVDQPAKGLMDLVSKARILSEIGGSERFDLADQLAASLAADILKLLPPVR